MNEPLISIPDSVKSKVLYKYCDPIGAQRILDDLELKMPYIKSVNDPYDCSPYFVYDHNFGKFKHRCLAALHRNGDPIPPEAKLWQEFEKGELVNRFMTESKRVLSEMNEKSCLLSVCSVADNPVMWAHYASNHEGAIVGIDFSRLFAKANIEKGIIMHPVDYAEKRPQLDILIDQHTTAYSEQVDRMISTKSKTWEYENEYRTLFYFRTLEKFQKIGLTIKKPFKGIDAWFLKLNPLAIRNVIFGLKTTVETKKEIITILSKHELSHVEKLKVVENDSFTFNIEEYKEDESL